MSPTDSIIDACPACEVFQDIARRKFAPSTGVLVMQCTYSNCWESERVGFSMMVTHGEYWADGCSDDFYALLNAMSRQWREWMADNLTALDAVIDKLLPCVVERQG